jgi:hypothetical protein
MTHTKDFYHLLLTYALIEIRAAETPEEKARIRKIADMLHNVGAALCFPWTEERDEDIYSYIQMKAEVHGLQDMLGHWERSILSRLAEPTPANGPQSPVTSTTGPHPSQST